MTESTASPILFGLSRPTRLQCMHYGPSCVSDNLLSCLSTLTSKAFIIITTSSSLVTKIDLIQGVEKLLRSGGGGNDDDDDQHHHHHAGTFCSLRQHAPIADLDRAMDAVSQDPNIDTLISISGGSPIDTAKVISHRMHERQGK